MLEHVVDYFGKLKEFLQEKFDKDELLPKFLLMENVNAINSEKHNKNFFNVAK